MSEIKEFYELADAIDATKISNPATRRQVMRFRNLARVLVDESRPIRQQIEALNQGAELVAAQRRQLLEQSDAELEQFERVADMLLRIRERTAAFRGRPVMGDELPADGKGIEKTD